MSIEYEIRDGALVWIKNPITGVISYVVDVSGKSFAFTLGAHEHSRSDSPELGDDDVRRAKSVCPFCPGNEDRTTAELFRLVREEIPGWTGDPSRDGQEWIIRVINNLFPRIPEQLTGGRNESYIVIEDPRHFIDHPRAMSDLLFTGILGEEQFAELIATDARVMRRSMENPHVRSVVVRKNQGRESGASQPHPHQQIIGSAEPLPAVFAEVRAEREHPGLWNEMIDLFDRLGLIIDSTDGVVTYASPIGAFPRSYDVMMPEFRGLLTDLETAALKTFARGLYRILRILGPLPLDYEIHQGEGLPLHAHINARLFPYSNVAGTLNIPNTLLERAAAIRKALARG